MRPERHLASDLAVCAGSAAPALPSKHSGSCSRPGLRAASHPEPTASCSGPQLGRRPVQGSRRPAPQQAPGQGPALPAAQLPPAACALGPR